MAPRQRKDKSLAWLPPRVYQRDGGSFTWYPPAGGSKVIAKKNARPDQVRERLGLDGARPSTPVGWSDTDWIRHLQEQGEPHPLAGQHINQGSLDAAADAYEAEYNAARGISEADKD